MTNKFHSGGIVKPDMPTPGLRMCGESVELFGGIAYIHRGFDMMEVLGSGVISESVMPSNIEVVTKGQ